ncbi:hypothetical protein ACOSP7_030520 [Xanthoceras sorbifolium]
MNHPSLKYSNSLLDDDLIFTFIYFEFLLLGIQSDSRRSGSVVALFTADTVHMGLSYASLMGLLVNDKTVFLPIMLRLINKNLLREKKIERKIGKRRKKSLETEGTESNGRKYFRDFKKLEGGDLIIFLIEKLTVNDILVIKTDGRGILTNTSNCSSDRTSSPSVKQLKFASISKALNFNLSVKLTRDNFVHWRAQILLAIRALSLEEYINGGRLCPNKFVEISATDGTTESIINEDFVAWCKTDQLLLYWLMSTISEGLIGEVTDCQSSLEFWRIIETLFSRESFAKVLQLKQQLQSVRKGSSTISEFILKIKGFGNGLRSAGQTVTNQDLLLSVLNGLGHEYDPVVVMLSQQQLTMSLHEAQYMLMIHEQRIEHLNSVAQVEVPAVPSANFVIKTTKPLELVYSDIWGPSPIISLEGFKYYINNPLVLLVQPILLMFVSSIKPSIVLNKHLVLGFTN